MVPEITSTLIAPHVIPALIKKFKEAVDRNSDTVEVWGNRYGIERVPGTWKMPPRALC